MSSNPPRCEWSSRTIHALLFYIDFFRGLDSPLVKPSTRRDASEDAAVFIREHNPEFLGHGEEILEKYRKIAKSMPNQPGVSNTQFLALYGSGVIPHATMKRMMGDDVPADVPLTLRAHNATLSSYYSAAQRNRFPHNTQVLPEDIETLGKDAKQIVQERKSRWTWEAVQALLKFLDEEKEYGNQLVDRKTRKHACVVAAGFVNDIVGTDFKGNQIEVKLENMAKEAHSPGTKLHNLAIKGTNAFTPEELEALKSLASKGPTVRN